MKEIQKEELKTFSFKYWKELVILILLAIGVFNFWLYNSKQNELKETLTNIKAKETAAAINAKTDPVAKREQEIYPQLNNEINRLNKSISSLNNKIKELEKNKPTKEDSNEIFKNKDAKALVKYFNDNGYNVSSSSCPGN